MSIEDMYYKDFGDAEAKAYANAKHALWEKHCEYPNRYPWPPSLEDIKAEIESDKWAGVADR